MTITAATIRRTVVVAADGYRRAKYPDGTSPPPGAIFALLTARGWGQTVTNGGTITGPAPLAVYFDGLSSAGETGVSTFREYGYHFDFGYATPSTPGTWTHSGAAKGNQVGGPLAAHLYLTPGTYSATMRVENAAAANSDATVTIVVQDPDTVYSTTNTVCLSTDGTATGGPTGCSYVTVTTSWPTWADNKRYLLKRGQDFSAAGSITINKSGGQLGYWGSGANPIIAGDLRFASTLPTSAAFVVDKWTVAHINCTSGTYGRRYYNQYQSRALTFYDCNGAIEFNCGFSSSNGFQQNASNGTTATWHLANQQFGVFECAVDYTGVSTGQTYKCVYAHYVQDLAVVGCTFDKNGDSHVIRTDCAYRIFSGHNYLQQPAQADHYFTMRGKGRLAWSTVLDDMADVTDTLKAETRYCVLADNKIGVAGEACSWKVSIHPTDSTSDESIQDCIIERNVFTTSTGGSSRKDIMMAGINIINRGNTLSSGEARRPDAQTALSAANTGPYYFQSLSPSLADEFTAAAEILPSKAGS